MSNYLNKNDAKFLSYLNDNIFIDKSMLIKFTNSSLKKESSKFMCVTRPRRFGKTLALSMLNAYYSKGCNSKEDFKSLKISKDESFLTHLSKHNVFWIDMASIYSDVKDKATILDVLTKDIIKDLNEAFPNILTTDDNTIGRALKKINSVTNETFIFLIDEWDVIFREEPNNIKLGDDYLMLFRSLFKSSDVSSCIDLVYITGILPIKRYTTQSALNVFIEYNMLNPYSLAEFIGFTENEVKGLCDEYKADFNEIKKWYNGYYYKSAGAIYSPKSVTMAISTGICSDYWTSTSAIEAVSNYMNYDNGVLKSEIIRMIAGEKVSVDVNDFENDLTKVDSKDAALTVLIHLGYLAYDMENRQCYIPNYEIKQEFERAVKKVKWMEIYTPISKSKELYYETLKGNTSYIDEFFNEMHSTFATQFNKNKEDVLGLLVHLSYYYCILDYDVKKEEVSILGRADISFIPKMNDKIPLIIELKADDKTSALDAVRQIKEKEYFNSLSSYKGEVILLGISYNSKTMKHHSHIEKITV